MMRFRTYDLPITFDVTRTVSENEVQVKDEIFKGFEAQAADIIKWIKKDQEQQEQIGRDYIREYFPSLIDGDLNCENYKEDDYKKLKDTLLAKMKKFFDASFRLLKTGNVESLWVSNLPNNLNSDEKETFHRLMLSNKHQGVVNRAIPFNNYPQSNARQWRVEGSWNWTGEPYTSSSTNSGEDQGNQPVVGTSQSATYEKVKRKSTSTLRLGRKKRRRKRLSARREPIRRQ